MKVRDGFLDRLRQIFASIVSSKPNETKEVDSNQRTVPGFAENASDDYKTRVQELAATRKPYANVPPDMID
jgi:hypothetical protein